MLTGAALALEAATYFIWRNDAALQIALSLVPPILTAAAYAITGQDAGLGFEAFSRTARRFWLVIAMDFLTTTIVALSFVSIGAGDVLTGVLFLAATVSLAYADVYLVLHDEPDGLFFIRSVGRSTVVAWHGLEIIGRTISLVALQLLPVLLSAQLQIRLVAQHVPFASFWSAAPLGTIMVPVVSVLTALVYLDATGHETKLTCGE